MKFYVRFIVACAISLAFASQAISQDKKPTPEEKAYKFRTSLFQTFAWKLGQLYGAQASEDEAAFGKHASDLVSLAGMIGEGFQIKDSLPEGTKAKPEIWQDPDLFKEKSEALVSAATALTQTGAMADFNVRDFGSKTCGGCHREFKIKD